MGERATWPQMTPKAAEAFDSYVAMGPSRSIRGLAELLTQRNLYKNSTAAHRVLADWSVIHQWQDRLASATTALTETRLERAAELDAGSFLKTSELIAERLSWTTVHNLDAVLKMRESVRKPTSKQATVTVTVEIRQAAEKVAAELGIPVDLVLSETYRMVEDGPA